MAQRPKMLDARTGSAVLILAIAAVAWNALPETGRAAETLPSVRIDGVPHVRQKPDFCGEACAQMWLDKLGKAYDQDDVFDVSGVDPLLGRGCATRGLATALRRIGFAVGPVWQKVAARADALEAPWRALHADLVAGIPSIVCMHYDSQPNTTEHFRLVLGYDAAEDEVLYHEPAVSDGAYRRMARSEFLALWPLKYESKRWTVIRLALKGDTIAPRPVPAAGVRYTDADFAQHVRKLKARLPDGFTMVLEKPFVVIGDEAESTIRRRAQGTVRWASRLLKDGFFAEDPLHILDVWLFKNKVSYEKNAERLFRSKPHTPYGYYSSHDRALVMNIATGGGTLVHEIVHPFVEANFPDCPPWLNEGLGSLYEQCMEHEGKIWGRTNWRLSGLKQAIRADRLPSFAALTAMNTGRFYGDGRGDHYAAARYLLYYLQERDLLRIFYRKFFAARVSDPTGYATLKKVLDEDDMADFQERWEQYVLRLKYAR